MADIKCFVETPSLEKLETLKKAELIEVCKFMKVETEIKKSFQKDQLKHIIVHHLVDNDILSGEALEKYPPLDVESPGLSELKWLQIEKENRLAEKDLEKQVKLAEVQAEKDLEKQVKLAEVQVKKILKLA